MTSTLAKEQVREFPTFPSRGPRHLTAPKLHRAEQRAQLSRKVGGQYSYLEGQLHFPFLQGLESP